MVSYVRLPSFLVTYGMATICRGIALIISGGVAQNTMFTEFKKLGNGNLFDVFPTMAVFAIVVFVIMHILTKKMRYGRSLYALPLIHILYNDVVHCCRPGADNLVYAPYNTGTEFAHYHSNGGRDLRIGGNADVCGGIFKKAFPKQKRIKFRLRRHLNFLET